MIMVLFLKMPLKVLLYDSLVRLVMNGVLVLSLVPMLNTGIGINFGLPIGIVSGLLGMCLAINYRFAGFSGFGIALLFSLFFGSILGYLYACLLNRVKGREEIASTFIGFSFISLMCLFWAVAPFTNPEMLWPIGGKGMRLTIGLENYFDKILNSLWVTEIFGIKIPCGLLAFFLLLCLLIYFFNKTKLGKGMRIVGENETFAYLSGINVLRTRTIAIVLSTVLGAFGICVYAQSYGFIELYTAPLMMAFPAASAILIGGSSGNRTSIGQVVVGTYLFQTIYVLSGPIANELLIPEFAEIIRMIITNLIILYALLYGEIRKNAQN
jgi:simple sugar transport system permease protein